MINISSSFNDDSHHVVVVEDSPWVKGQDVATSLEYAKTTKALREHVDSGIEKKEALVNTNKARFVLKL